MKTSDKGIALIEHFESFAAKMYICPAGKPTIGFGDVIRPGEKFGTLTHTDAVNLLAKDLISREVAVTNFIDVPLTQGQFDALVSFIYNLGENVLKTSTLAKKLNAKDYAGAADQFLVWDKAHVKGALVALNGLKARRNAERHLFLTGDFDADA